MTPGPVSEPYDPDPEDERILRCAFCQEEYPPGTPPTQDEALTAHVMVCESHPLGVIVRNLAIGLRKAKAYPTTREKTIDRLLDYLRSNGFGGNPLR